MGPEVVEILAPVLAFVSIGGLILIGMKLRYSHKERTQLGGTSQQEVERLTDTVNALRDEVHVLRDGYLGFNERVEFAERLLERPRADSDARHRQKD
jgi:cell division protein FtsB